MLRYVAIALVAATAAQANPAPKKDVVDEALKREQRIQELSAPPRSLSNICRGC